MPPIDYEKARSMEDSTTATTSSSSSSCEENAITVTKKKKSSSTTSTWVDGYPYLWQYRVDPNDDMEAVKDVCVQIFGQIRAADDDDKQVVDYDSSYDATCLKVERVSGGITNTLFKVSGLHSIFSPLTTDESNNNSNNNTTTKLPNDVLVRLFGAEGMINRDEETYYFSILASSDSGIAPPYFGRFQNGRLEGWMQDMRPLQTHELLQLPGLQSSIAQALAQLHATHVPRPSDHHDDNRSSNTSQEPEPTLWTQLEDWYQQALNNTGTYQTSHDEQRARDAKLEQYRAELDWLRNTILVDQQNDLKVAFCHNDLLAANILYSTTSDDKNKINKIQLIDFEYGGWNYTSFDIANHWNEYAGGPPDSPHPDYSLLPNAAQRRQFCRAYLVEQQKLQLLQLSSSSSSSDQSSSNDIVATVTDEQVTELVHQVETFLMPNHLYWGFWAINQTATEGCEDYDYMEFARSRLAQYWVCKQEQQQQQHVVVVGGAAATTTTTVQEEEDDEK